MAQRIEAMESCAYGSCIHYCSGTLINSSSLFFMLAWSNPYARQEKFYHKTDSKGHIFQKRYTKNPSIRQYTRFCDEDLSLWLDKIKWKPYKTPPYHTESNGLGERMMKTVKIGLKVCSQLKEKIQVFLPRLLLSCRTIPPAGRLESPSALMGNKNIGSANDVVFHKWKRVVQKE